MLRGRPNKRLLAMMIAALVAVGASGLMPLLASNHNRVGLFGEVLGVTAGSLGTLILDLATVSRGLQQVTIVATTQVNVPGRARASVDDISEGDFLAVLARTVDDSLEAQRVMVKPDSPVLHSHITGSVIGSDGEQVSIMDADGNVITMDILLRQRGLPTVFTGVVRHDPRTGNLSLLAAESAEDKVSRLERALAAADRAGARRNQASFEVRLAANVTGHLTTLQEVLDRVEPGKRFIFDEALRGAAQKHATLLESRGLGKPSVKVAGNIEAADLAAGILIVTPSEGPSLRLTLSSEAQVIRFGERATPGQLEAGQAVRARYERGTKLVLSVDVLFPSLARELVASSIGQVEAGELRGTIHPDSDPPTVVIQLDSGRLVMLTITEKTRVVIQDQPGEVEQLLVAAPVKVRFDTATLEALDIEMFDERSGQEFVSGVVRAFVPKTHQVVRIPGGVGPGNIIIVRPGGGAVTLSVTDDTVIEREGLRLTIHAVRVGDVVRPTSRFRTDTGEILKLALKAAGLRGTVRGLSVTPGGAGRITISTDELDVVTLKVTPTTRIELDGLEVGIDDVKAGQRVVSGIYDAVSLRATLLELASPATLRSSGTITTLDDDEDRDPVATLTTPSGDTIRLLVPKNVEVLASDGSTLSREAIQPGVDVQVVYYGPGQIMVKIVLA